MPERLAQHLISRGLLPASKVDSALRLQSVSKGGLDSALLEQGLVSEVGLLQALADVSGLQPVNLADFEPNVEASAQLPRKIAERLSVAPLSIDGGTLHLAVCYPPPKDQLKEVSFLLGKKLELWVAIEARVHDWNATVYDSPLAPRFERLLRQLDPARRARTGSKAQAVVEEMTELVTDEVVKRATGKGTPEEPILLEKPKVKRRPTLEVISDPRAIHEAQDTVFINVSRYTELENEKKKRQAPDGDDFREETSVLDLDQYADFARKATDTARSDPHLPQVRAHPPPAVTPAAPVQWDDTTSPGEPEPPKLGAFKFPGGVLPPARKKEESPKGPPAPLPRVSPAPPPRPRLSAAKPDARVLSLDEEITRRSEAPARPGPEGALTDFAIAARMPMPPAAPELSSPAPATTAPVVTAAPAVPRDETDFSDLQSSPGISLAEVQRRAGIPLSEMPPPVPSSPPPENVQLVTSDPLPTPAPEPTHVSLVNPVPSPPVLDAALDAGAQPDAALDAVQTAPDAAFDAVQTAPDAAFDAVQTAPDAALDAGSAPPAPFDAEPRPEPDATAPLGVPAVAAPDAEPPSDPEAWQQAQAQWSGEQAEGAFTMPTAEEWAALPPEAQAAWWAQYEAAYGQQQWPPDSSGAAEGWVSSDESVPVDMTSGETPVPPPSGPDKLPPEDDTWLMLPPGSRPFAPGALPPPPPPPSAPPVPDAVPPPRPQPKLPDAPQEWTLPRARELLRSATQDREVLLEVALRFALRAFDFAAAFAVVRGVAVGWAAKGEGDDAMIREVAIPLDVSSVFRTVALTRGSYVGPMPNDSHTQHYLGLMGRMPRTLFVWPLEVKGRLVAILYADAGQKPVSQRKLSDFMLFCNELPGAFHELLVFRKQRMGERAAFTPHESGDARPAAMSEAETQVGVPTVEEPGADDGILGDLLALLTGPDANDRAGAMTELMKTPEASARALVAAFPGPTAWSRLPVVELPEADELGPVPGALARLGRAGAVALAPLLDSADSDVRYLALLTAGSVPHPELVDGLMRGLFDVEPDISSAARAAATSFRGMLKFDALIPDLRRELIARDPMNRSLAARALGVLRDREAVSGLIDLVDDPDELCAQSAVESLREITRQNHGSDHDAWNRWWTVAKDRRRVEWLIDALDSPDFDARLAAIDELARAHGDNLGYFADGTDDERALGVQKWRALLELKPELEV